MAFSKEYWKYYNKGGRLSPDAWQASKTYAAASEAAKQANISRYQQGLDIWKSIEAQYLPGGGFGQGALATYERTKERDIARASQSLVSSGLYGTTITAGLGKKYEEEVGQPFKLNLEDIRQQRLSEARGGMAGFIERREDVAPDPGLYANLMQGAAATPRTVTTGGGGAWQKGPSPGDPGYMGGGWTLGEQAWEKPGYKPGGGGVAGITPSYTPGTTGAIGAANVQSGREEFAETTGAKTTDYESRWRDWLRGEMGKIESQYAKYRTAGETTTSRFQIKCNFTNEGGDMAGIIWQDSDTI